MQVSKILDPFSIPAQLNNLGLFVVAYVTQSAHQTTNCQDPSNEHFLNFIFYGSIFVCGGTFLLSILYVLGVIDYCINKICPCGEVCLTLNTLGIFLAGIIYHCVATVYGVAMLMWGRESPCIELEMFKQIAGIIYSIWVLGIIGFVLFMMYRSRVRANLDLRGRFINA